MNLDLLDPFAKTVPDHVDSVLSYGVEDATVCSFDKRGTYLAVGYATGVVVIWDFVTRGIGRVIEAHARAITALSWARGGRRLLSASHDHRLHFWALEPARPELIRVICLDSPIMSALMLPGSHPTALAQTADGVAHLIDIKESSTKSLLTTEGAFCSSSSATPVGSPSPAKKSKPNSSLGESATAASGLPSSLPAVLCVALDRRTPSVCLGTSNGRVVSVRPSDGEVISTISVVGCSKVKQLDFSRNGKWMLVNGGERVIRMLERGTTTGRSVRDFQDVVNRTRWQCCRFTGDSEYIAGGSRAEATCSIYIWTVEGHLVTRLEGPQMGLLSLARHPVRPFLAAALTNGKVQLWGQTHTANWTAFAADFEELEENVEYVEREDEFDVVVDSRDPEGRMRMAEKEQEEEEAIVSIEAIDTVSAWSTDSEGEGSGKLFYLSTEPGAAAREGWYDLEVQTSKRGRSAPWETDQQPLDDQREEWTSSRIKEAVSIEEELVVENVGTGRKERGGGGGGRSGGGAPRKRKSGIHSSSKASRMNSGSKSDLHRARVGNQSRGLGGRPSKDADGGGGGGGGGSGGVGGGGGGSSSAGDTLSVTPASAAAEEGSHEKNVWGISSPIVDGSASGQQHRVSAGNDANVRHPTLPPTSAGSGGAGP